MREIFVYPLIYTCDDFCILYLFIIDDCQIDGLVRGLPTPKLLKTGYFDLFVWKPGMQHTKNNELLHSLH